MNFVDYYDVLGVADSSSVELITKAFREKAKLWHPDVNSAHNAAEMFRNAYEAYEILKDPAKRKYHDKLRAEVRASQQVVRFQPKTVPPPIVVQPEYVEWTRQADRKADAGAKTPYNEFVDSLYHAVKEGGLSSAYISWCILGTVAGIVGLISGPIGWIVGIIVVIIINVRARSRKA